MTTRLLRSPIVLLFAGGVLIFVVASGFWWTKVHQSPYNVFWGMVENNLSTPGVTKHVTQYSNATGLDQTLVSTFGAQNAVHALTTLKTNKSTVKTETIGTPSDDAVRYTSVNTTQWSKSGKPFDFSKILGKWAIGKVDNSSDTRATAGLFAQTSLGLMGGNIIPQANLLPADRRDLLKRLHNEVVFDVPYGQVKKSRHGGRSIYTYDVNIQPVAYVGFEKVFAHDLGLKALDGVEPNNYQGQSAIKVTLSVDAWSHQLVGVDYPGQNHHEAYSGYGVVAPTVLPKATISSTALQSLLGNIQ
jgi:hypothetical protein